jgi:low temperature requirement protein LtrA
MTFGARSTLLRLRGGHENGRVTFLELFFDLMFAFAITQLHRMLAYLTPLGTIETAMLFSAVWIVWISMAWCTNGVDPQRTPACSSSSRLAS